MIVKMLKRGLLLCVRWLDDREDAEAWPVVVRQVAG